MVVLSKLLIHTIGYALGNFTLSFEKHQWKKLLAFSNAIHKLNNIGNKYGGEHAKYINICM